jgi:hypothetical protein
MSGADVLLEHLDADIVSMAFDIIRKTTGRGVAKTPLLPEAQCFVAEYIGSQYVTSQYSTPTVTPRTPVSPTQGYFILPHPNNKSRFKDLYDHFSNLFAIPKATENKKGEQTNDKR